MNIAEKLPTADVVAVAAVAYGKLPVDVGDASGRVGVVTERVGVAGGAIASVVIGFVAADEVGGVGGSPLGGVVVASQSVVVVVDLGALVLPIARVAHDDGDDGASGDVPGHSSIVAKFR